MVSTESYLNIFAEVMPQRIKKIKKTFGLKTGLDSKLKEQIKKKRYSTEDIIALQNLIGKDALFSKPEKRKGSQTLRHYVWKSQKSFKSLGDYLSDYLKTADKDALKELESNNILLGQTVEKIVSISGRASDLTETVDKMLTRESKSLQTILDKLQKSGANYVLTEEDVAEYFRTVSNEWVALKALEELFSSFKIILANFQKSVSAYFKEKNYRKRSADAPRIVQDVITIAAVIGYALSIYVAYQNQSGDGILSGFSESAIARDVAVISTAVAVVSRIVLPFIPSPESKALTKALSELNWTE